MDNLTRRNIRYICFRLQTEAEGGNKATPEETGVMSHVEEVKELMEAQPEFEGWKKFAKTWDVDEKAKLVAVNRSSSIQADWNKVLKQEAKELPTPEKKKKSRKKVTSTPASSPSRPAIHRGPGGKFVSKSTAPPPPAQDPTPPPPVSEIIPASEGSKKDESPDKAKKKNFWEMLK